MKKLIGFAFAGLIGSTGYAAEMSCGYKDFFYLSKKTNPGIYVVSGYSDSDVILELVGPRSFVVRDGYQCHSGFAHVTIAYDMANWCVLDIKDGPYMNHPTISASCNGLHYRDTRYDGPGSYSYAITID